MAPPKDIARSYPKRGITGDVGFRSEPTFVGDGSINFDGTSDAASSSSPINVKGSGSKVTLAAWVRCSSDSSGNHTILSNTVDTNDNQITLYRNGDDLLCSAVYASGFTKVNHAANAQVTVGAWHFICAVWDFDSTSLTFYLDGVRFSDTPVSAVGSTNSTFEIGGRDPAGSLSQQFDGEIASACMWSTTLTESQVLSFMREPTYANAQSVGTVNRFYALTANFNDSTGSHNASSVGTPLVTVTKPQLPRGLDLVRGAAMARCLTGRCVDFDGSTDFLDMGTGVDKNYTTRSDRASFSCWFNTDQISAAAWIYQNRTQLGGTSRSECETQLFTHPSLGLVFDGDFASILIPTTDFNIGQWHHFVGIADDSAGPVKAYLDGVLYDTTSIPQSGANGSEFLIGGRNNSPLQLFNGQLSNFKIFNVELTQSQVRELYHNPEMVIPTGVSASNLRRHYPLCAYNDTGGMGGRYEIDQGVEGVNGEYGGSPVMDFAQPVPCPQLGLQQSATRLYFPGATTTTAATIPALGTAASLSCWFFWDDSSRTSYPIAVGTVNSTTDGLNIRIDTSGNVTTYENAAFDSGLNVTEGTWNHIVIVSQTASPYWKCFVNNVEATSPAAKSAAINITSTNAHVGTNAVNFGAAGIVADAAIWSSELSGANVAALYNSGVMGADVSQVDSSNLVAWWKCDDLASCKDFSGNGRSMAITTALNAVQFPENASGSTLVGDISMKRKGASVLNCFDDPGAQRVRTEIPSGAGLQPSLTNGHTVSIWYRNQMQNTTSANNGTMVLGGNDSSNDRFILEAVNGNTFRGVYGAQTANSTATISDNEWHHYAMVLDVTTASPTIRLYLDGVAAGTQSGTLSATFPEGVTLIGGPSATRSGFDYGLKGPIACPRIYAFQLSENEIKQIYNSDLRLIKGLENE